MKDAKTSEVAKIYGATDCQILEGSERGFIPGENGIQLREGQEIELEDEVYLIKTPRLPMGMKVISLRGTKEKLPIGTLLKRDSERKLHADTEALLEASRAKDADGLIKWLVGKPIIVTSIGTIQVQKFVDGQPVAGETVDGRRYSFKLKA